MPSGLLCSRNHKCVSSFGRAHCGCVRVSAAERSKVRRGFGRRGNQLLAPAGMGCSPLWRTGRPFSPNPAANLAGLEGIVIQFPCAGCPWARALGSLAGLREDSLDEQRASTDLPPLPRFHDHRTGLVRGIQHLPVLRLRPRSHFCPSHRPPGRRRRPPAPAPAPTITWKTPPLTYAPPTRRPLARFTSFERACHSRRACSLSVNLAIADSRDCDYSDD
jgi:hypothetical protein